MRSRAGKMDRRAGIRLTKGSRLFHGLFMEAEVDWTLFEEARQLQGGSRVALLPCGTGSHENVDRRPCPSHNRIGVKRC